ncbi:MAG: methylthioribulose 1-phosphate dehydratase [Actinomycetota bacterium]|nr:methylthioribulose 1-phosphate dehydratase [Actinomycetota bacterium]
MGADSAHSEESGTRALLCEMLRLFYDKGWVSGTGGGICASLTEGRLLVAPTGVHKERVEPADLFLIDPGTGDVIGSAADAALRPSECTPIFSAIVRAGAGAVVHSHALSAVLAGDAAKGSVLTIESLEMLKGLPEVSNTDVHFVPVIENAEHEPELTSDVERALSEERFSSARAIVVRDHGAYIWGRDIWEAKKHTEVYHFLFEATVARRH